MRRLKEILRRESRVDLSATTSDAQPARADGNVPLTARAARGTNEAHALGTGRSAARPQPDSKGGFTMNWTTARLLSRGLCAVAVAVVCLSFVTPVAAGVSIGPTDPAADQAPTVPAPAPADAAAGPCSALSSDAAVDLEADPIDGGDEINFTPVSGDSVFSILPVADRPRSHFRGYCRCSCSFTKNCNTSADCGGAACTSSISCC